MERYFQLSIEGVIDIGEIIISDLKLDKPEEYRQAIEILGDHGVLPDEFHQPGIGRLLIGPSLAVPADQLVGADGHPVGNLSPQTGQKSLRAVHRLSLLGSCGLSADPVAGQGPERLLTIGPFDPMMF